MIQLVKLIITLVMTLLGFQTNAQLTTSSELHKTLKVKDSMLFTAAFKECDVEKVGELLDTDFEFYHDKGGITNSYEAFIENMNSNCNSRKGETMPPAKRKLVEGSLEVYPLYDNGKLYGAIQKGIHKFFVLENNTYRKGDIAKFTHLWVLVDNIWKLKRVLSYDHKLNQ